MQFRGKNRAVPSQTLFAAAQIIVGREQSDLINNTTYYHTDCCRKGV